MPELEPIPRSPVVAPSGSTTDGTPGGPTLVDESLAPKWRVVGDAYPAVVPGTAQRRADLLVWSVTPAEWTVVGPRPAGGTVVDLTHVRAMFRLSGEDAPALLSRLCAIDLGDAMFPAGAAARTLVAGVATEIVRDDDPTEGRSYLLLPSRSFGRYLHDAIVDAGHDLGIGPRSSED